MLGIGLVMRRGGRTGQVEHDIDLARPAQQGGWQRVADIGFDHLEAWLMRQMREVDAPAGEEAVEADHLRALGQQGVAEMRAEEPRPARDDGQIALRGPHSGTRPTDGIAAQRAGAAAPGWRETMPSRLRQYGP